jgi:hypothetical protein
MSEENVKVVRVREFWRDNDEALKAMGLEE